MRKSHRKLIVVVTGLALATGFILAANHSDRTRQRAMRLHSRNSISAHTFLISTNALATNQIQKP